MSLMAAGLGYRLHLSGQGFEAGALVNAYYVDANAFQLGKHLPWTGRGGDNQPLWSQRENAFGCQVAQVAYRGQGGNGVGKLAGVVTSYHPLQRIERGQDLGDIATDDYGARRQAGQR